MWGTAPFIMYIAMFILTWPAHFAVRGMPKTRNEQCKELGYEGACKLNKQRNLCQVLTCGRSSNSYRRPNNYVTHPLILRNGVPDDTECGESKICMSGKCVAAPSMPHYRSRVYYFPCTQIRLEKNEPLPTRRQQCQRYGFDVACLKDVRGADTSCTSLNCGYKASDEFFLYKRPCKLRNMLHPLTGTRCGCNGVCLKRKCIPLTEWLSSRPHPTYTGLENWDICRED